MTCDDFAQALAALVLAPAAYPDLDLEDYAILQAEFALLRLEQPRALPVITHTELDELFARFEVVGLSSCGITFFDLPFETEYGVTVAGEQEVTFTVAPNGTICLHTEEETTPCAQSVSGFYQALLVFAEYYQQRRRSQVARWDHAVDSPAVALPRRESRPLGPTISTC